jgi:hypothetical protein
MVVLWTVARDSYINTAVEVDPEKPVLVDKYLDRAVELDVDALRDEQGNIVICGIMEHIEQVCFLSSGLLCHGCSSRTSATHFHPWSWANLPRH